MLTLSYYKPGDKAKFELVDPCAPPLEVGEWNKVFLFKPRLISGKTHWLKWAYRRLERVEVESVFGHSFHVVWNYGTVFDILKD
jgi:hypothetical protein